MSLLGRVSRWRRLLLLACGVASLGMLSGQQKVSAVSCTDVGLYASTHQGTSPLSVSMFLFTLASTPPVIVQGVPANWDFGDGTFCPNCGLSVTHVYQGCGVTFKPKVTIFTSDCGYRTVGPTPVKVTCGGGGGGGY